MATAADVRMQGFRRRSEVPSVLTWIDRHCASSGRRVGVHRRCDLARARVRCRRDHRRAGLRPFRHGRLRPAWRRHLGRKRIQPDLASGGGTGAARAATRSCGARGQRRAHHDRRADPGRRRRRRPRGVRIRIRRTHRDHAAGRAGPARRAPSARMSRRATTVLRAGRRLRAQDVALVASLGQSHVDAVQRPRVRIVVTGNEVVAPGTAKQRVPDLRRQLVHAARPSRARRRGARDAQCGSATIRERSARH